MSKRSDLVVLVNLGTPEAPTHSAVATFLHEFLSDAKVVDWPAWIWQPVLGGIILRVRPRRVARLYQEIWGEDGSPLEAGTKRTARALQDRMGASTEVRWAYRYGREALAQQLPRWVDDSARGNRIEESVDGRIVVVPLFPQRTGSSSGTIVAEARRLAEGTSWGHRLEIRELAPDDLGYIEALAQRTLAVLSPLETRRVTSEQAGMSDQPVVSGQADASLSEARRLRGDEVDHLLLSFHGIPLRYDRNERGIYQSDCERTVSALLARLGWPREKATLCYQSRFGPERWLGPATARLLRTLPRRGVRKIAIATPGFVTEGLETLEEIGRLGRSQFLSAGGESFIRIPAVGDHEAFVTGLTGLIRSEVR